MQDQLENNGAKCGVLVKRKKVCVLLFVSCLLSAAIRDYSLSAVVCVLLVSAVRCALSLVGCML